MRPKVIVAIVIPACAFILGLWFFVFEGAWLRWIVEGRETIASRVEETRPRFEETLGKRLRDLNLSTTPEAVTLVFLKDTRELHLYAGPSETELILVKTYDVKAASGKEGPKLREGDRQVPEGIYRIEALNPNSDYYLSLRVNYPNSDDQKFASEEGRSSLGGDIMIHGSRVSMGCLAIGNEAVAELFHLAATTNFRKWTLLLAPSDLRAKRPPAEVVERHPWMRQIYQKLRDELYRLPQGKE